MLRLEHGPLSLDLLDPRTDTRRLGPRYCAGGSIHQVHHRDAGALLAGPEYPADTPSVINGQGMPEVFQHTLFTDPDEIPAEKLIIGVGTVANTTRGTNTDLHFANTIAAPCSWEVTADTRHALFATRQSLGPWSLALEKTVWLGDDVAASGTRLRNLGEVPLPFRWFAHPFFPLRADRACGLLPEGWSFPDNPGFALEGRTIVRRNADGWDRGHYLAVSVGSELACRCAHPHLEAVVLQGDFPLLRVALWANERTFSLEPFRGGVLLPGEETSWELRTTFVALTRTPS
jgi:hypothetical protein